MNDPRLASITSPPLSQPDPSSSSSCGDACCEDQDTTNLAEEQIVHEDKQDKHKQVEEILKDSKQNREQRKEYANKIFYLVCAWLFVLTVIVCFSGIRLLWLTDTVLVALISGASVNIIGLMVIVANYLFPKNGHIQQGLKNN